MEVIPAIDLLGGKCVRLYQGDFARVSVYGDEPVSLAARYRAAGLGRIHVVDLDGARAGTPGNNGTIRAIAAEGGAAVQVGGGIRSADGIRDLLAAGAGRVVLGSVAAEQPETTRDWLAEFGPDRLVLALDVRLGPDGEPLVVTRGWTAGTGATLWSLVEAYLGAGLRHVLCTDVARDGAMAGPNLDLYVRLAARYPAVGFIASGGVRSVADLRALADTGVAAVVTGKAILDGHITLAEAARFSRAA